MSDLLTIYIDGACSGNPGPAAVGIVIWQEGKKIKGISQAIGPGTNNIAEYTALLYALREASKLKAEKLKIYTDSQLMFEQVTGRYKVKNENIKLLFDQVQHLASGFKKIDMQHISREKNADADKLATQALKKRQAEMVAPLFQRSGEESPSSEG